MQITSEVPGNVMALNADDTQGVRRGQTLLELDPADAQVAMSNAEARLARAVREVRTLFATAEELRAQITEREIELKRAQDDYGRRSNLLQDGAVSSEELSHTQDNTAQMRASLIAAREQLNATEAQIQGTTIPTHPQVLDAAAALRNVALALHRTELSAPVSGVIAKRSVQVGQRVAQLGNRTAASTSKRLTAIPPLHAEMLTNACKCFRGSGCVSVSAKAFC